jgi:hypothetical protein
MSVLYVKLAPGNRRICVSSYQCSSKTKAKKGERT